MAVELSIAVAAARIRTGFTGGLLRHDQMVDAVYGLFDAVIYRLHEIHIVVSGFPDWAGVS